VETPKTAKTVVVPDTVPAAAAAAVASTSSTVTISPPRNNPNSIQLISFFVDTLQRLFKVPTSVDLSYGGFEVTFSTASVPWIIGLSSQTATPRIPASDSDADDDDDARVFDLMPAPANSALHRYIRELTRVRADLAALEAEPEVDDVELRIRAELQSAQGWIRRVCEAAGALSIADPAFSPKK